MNEGNSKLPKIILFVVIVVVGILALKFIVFNDFTNKDQADNNTSKYNDKPALTLKSDKQAQAKLKEKQEQEEKDKDKDKKDDKKKDKDKDQKEDEKASIKKMRKDAQDKALKTLEIQSKPKDQFKDKSTQTLFNNVATKDYVKAHKGSNNKGDKTIKYKNVKIDISDKELKKSNPKGTLQFDRLVNPKDKSSKVKPSTEVDSKVSVTFKKEGNTLKVDGTQT